VKEGQKEMQREVEGSQEKKDETTTTRHSLSVSSRKEKSREEKTDSLSGEHAE